MPRPVVLASFLFDVLHNNNSSSNEQGALESGGEASQDHDLDVFDACLTVLEKVRSALSEAQYSLLFEGVRRQMAELAITLLLAYADDDARLVRIMTKLMDANIHSIFAHTSFAATNESFDSLLAHLNPFQPNFKRIKQQQQQADASIDPLPPRRLVEPSEALAHFMFEFSKAGGSITFSSVFPPTQQQQQQVPNRHLHICSFMLSLYALGVHNGVQANLTQNEV